MVWLASSARPQWGSNILVVAVDQTIQSCIRGRARGGGEERVEEGRPDHATPFLGGSCTYLEKYRPLMKGRQSLHSQASDTKYSSSCCTRTGSRNCSDMTTSRGCVQYESTGQLHGRRQHVRRIRCSLRLVFEDCKARPPLSPTTGYMVALSGLLKHK